MIILKYDKKYVLKIMNYLVTVPIPCVPEPVFKPLIYHE